MFSDRDLSPEVTRVREIHAPDALVYDVETDFETLDPAVAEELGLRADSLEPLSYDPAWVPGDAPEALHRLASGAFTIGAPGDGGVAWTRQTVPPTVLVKPRLRGSPPSFVAFLVAEALVEVGLDVPETFLGFFGARYPELSAATPLSPADTYQLGAALFDAWVGLHTRETFADEWGAPADGEPTYPTLSDAWRDAGERLEPRLAGLAGEVARGETGFAAAAELACSAVKHGVDLPTPFGALDTAAYRQHGPEYAVRWAEKTFEKLEG
jgi:hypothetical protein